MWHAYSTNETLSNDTRVNDLVTMTVTFMLKIANLVSVAAGGFRVFHKLVLFLLNLGFMSKSILDSPPRYVFFDIVYCPFMHW